MINAKKTHKRSFTTEHLTMAYKFIELDIKPDHRADWILVYDAYMKSIADRRQYIGKDAVRHVIKAGELRDYFGEEVYINLLPNDAAKMDQMLDVILCRTPNQ